jgi:hypothetical protein
LISSEIVILYQSSLFLLVGAILLAAMIATVSFGALPGAFL